MLGASAIFANGTAVAADDFIQTTHIGNPDNIGDYDNNGLGKVIYEYYISTYEVTATQYATFLNAAANISDDYGLYHDWMAGDKKNSMGCGIRKIQLEGGSFKYTVDEGYENKPVNYVTYWDALRFCNWLTTGNTEHGVYELSGATSLASEERNSQYWNANPSGMVVALPTEDEWYKAAYHHPAYQEGLNGPWSLEGYSLYPTNSESISQSDANYGRGFQADIIEDVDYGKSSYYGTYGQGGNVWEWTEAIAVGSTDRIMRGGWADSTDAELKKSYSVFEDPTSEVKSHGFRVVSLAPITVPEPGTYALLGGALLSGAIFLRRRKK